MASDLKEARNTIIEEDNLRELYSLDINKPDPIKLPTFSGLEGEDYLDFKEKILKGFVQNRITRADKLAKLRECLKGDALKLVPESTTGDIDVAFATLDKAYGKTIRVVRYKREQLFRLGFQPKLN